MWKITLLSLFVLSGCMSNTINNTDSMTPKTDEEIILMECMSVNSAVCIMIGDYIAMPL